MILIRKYYYFVFWLYVSIILPLVTTSDENETPLDWPTDWTSGIIPYALNFFSPNPKRLLGLVKRGLAYMENNSCLRFEEQDPVKSAKLEDFTYLYFTYSGVLEDCCLKYYTKHVGRRTVLITPVCSDPAEVAHATLHGMGLTHPPGEPFNEADVTPITQEWCNNLNELKAIRMKPIELTTAKLRMKKKTTTHTARHHVGIRPNDGLRSRPNDNTSIAAIARIMQRKIYQKKMARNIGLTNDYI